MQNTDSAGARRVSYGALRTGTTLFFLSEIQIIGGVLLWLTSPYPLKARIISLLWGFNLTLLLLLLFAVLSGESFLMERFGFLRPFRHYLLSVSSFLMAVFTAAAALLSAPWVEAPRPWTLLISTAVVGAGNLVLGPLVFGHSVDDGNRTLRMQPRIFLWIASLILFVVGTLILQGWYSSFRQRITDRASVLALLLDGQDASRSSRLARSMDASSGYMPILKGNAYGLRRLPVWARHILRTSSSGVFIVPGMRSGVVFKKRAGVVRAFVFPVHPPPILPIPMVLSLLGVLLLSVVGMVLLVQGMSVAIRRLEYYLRALSSGLLDEEVQAPQGMDEFSRMLAVVEGLRKILREHLSGNERSARHLRELVDERTEALTEVRRDLREALEDLRETQQRLLVMERLAAVGRLVSNLAHELNNPMNALENALIPLRETVMECSGLPDDVREDIASMLSIMMRSVERIRSLVDSLSRGMRLPAGERIAVSLPEVIQASLSMTAHLMKDVTVSARYENLCVRAHPGPLEQVFTNLLVNAVQAMDAGSHERKLDILLEREGNEAVVRVRDTGTGIPEEVRGKVFEPFITTKDAGHGTGLGLSIVHNIVSRYDGTVFIEDTGPGGTTVAVRFPIEGECDGQGSHVDKNS